MRGKRNKLTVLRTALGITPAHAGKTFSGQSRKKQGWDHPRACGENNSAILHALCIRGSPPRMRGKPKCIKKPMKASGITPAHAGKTPDRFEETRESWDHPRACGENTCPESPISFSPGSPPRMRGKHFGKGVFPWLILVLSLDPL